MVSAKQETMKRVPSSFRWRLPITICAVLALSALVGQVAFISRASDDRSLTTVEEKYESFDDDCFLHRDTHRRNLAKKTKARKDEDDADMDTDDGDEKEERVEKAGPPDGNNLGPCRYKYPGRQPPKEGYLNGIDFFHFRESHSKREQCFLFCIEHLAEKGPLDPSLLVDAAMMGLEQVATTLYTKYGLDPLHHPSLGPDYEDKPAFNAIQEAIRGGHTGIVKALSNSNRNMVIDKLGRTVKDYISMKGSPIRPTDAASILHFDTSKEQRRNANSAESENVVFYGESGWNNKTFTSYDETCDIDVVYGHMSREVFYNDYFMTGRPFVLRGAVPEPEVQAFFKNRWEETTRFHPKTPVRVGPTAYPGMTGQKSCSEKIAIHDLEAGAECTEMPGIPMVHARHPGDRDLDELFPMYDGDIYDKKGGWRTLEEWFGANVWDYNPPLQVFMGGDGSGATFHWHNAAFNVLYVGIKEWKISPPKYRGFTGMPARSAYKQVDNAVSLRCTQRPGDLMFIPDSWGHLTVNHGFSIGAAVILPNSLQLTADAKPKVFFVHINKTGGTSMIKMLNKRCGSQYAAEKWGDGHRTFHATAHALIERNGRDVWDSAYTFTVVRHPLARLVSNFFFLIGFCEKKRVSKICKERLVPAEMDLGSMTDEQKIEAFYEYIWDLHKAYPPGSKKHYLFGGFGHGNEVYDTLNATQTSWLVDQKGELAVKNVFKLENLSEDTSKLVDAVPCLGRKEGMEHANPTATYPKPYSLYAKNKRTNQIVREVFAVDFKNFGYDLSQTRK